MKFLILEFLKPDMKQFSSHLLTVLVLSESECFFTNYEKFKVIMI